MPMPAPTPLPPQIEQFLHDNPQGVLTSFRKNGMPQLSIVTVYPRDGGVGISITESRMKFKNLLRDPRCSVLVSHVDWWSGFLVFEGRAELTHSGNTEPDALRRARRHIYSATTRRRSADWGEYDRIAEADKRVAMVLRPDHIYGSALARLREAADPPLTGGPLSNPSPPARGRGAGERGGMIGGQMTFAAPRRSAMRAGKGRLGDGGPAGDRAARWPSGSRARAPTWR